VVGGTVIATGAAVGGLAVGLAGGLGGAYINMREGAQEVVDATRRSSTTNRPMALAGSKAPEETLLLTEGETDLAEKGRMLYSKSMSGENFSTDIL
jgi:hypothetical protein